MSAQIITQEYLLSRLEYRCGTLYWRPIEVTGIWQKRWNARYSHKSISNIRSSGYYQATLTIDNIKRHYAAHRLIFLIVNGYMPAEIDHIDGNRLNNNIDNLRDVTRAENAKNKRISSLNTSGIMGVSWCKSREKWVAQIKVGGKPVYLGRHNNKFDAMAARKSAELKYGFHPNHGRK